MKKIISLFATALILLQTTTAQVTEAESKLRAASTDTVQGWRVGGILMLNVSQASLTNWAAGGQNSVSINGLISLFANYKKGKVEWDNSLDVGYGVLQQGKNSKFIKTDDKIDFVSKYGKEIFDHVYSAALLNFKTQMTPGYNYPNDSLVISNLFAPAYVIAALGLDYRPDKYFSLFVAPATSRNTIVNDQTLADAGAFGVDKASYDASGKLIKHGAKFRSEFGGYIRIIYSRNDFKSEFLKNVSFTTKVDLFSNYLKNPQNIVVNWETLIALKVNKFISASINTQLIYDDDINIVLSTNKEGKPDKVGPRTQFKELLGVGLSYKF